MKSIAPCLFISFALIALFGFINLEPQALFKNNSVEKALKLPPIIDSCWTMVNSDSEPPRFGLQTLDIENMTPSSDGGFFTYGFFNFTTFNSQDGNTIRKLGQGGYVAKYNAGGDLKWIVNTDGLNNDDESKDVVKSVVEDSEGNIYLCGLSQGKFIDRSGKIITWDTEFPGTYIGFVVKLDSEGNHIWDYYSLEATPNILETDKENNLIISTVTGGVITTWVGENEFEYSNRVASANWPNFQILKLDSEGIFQWNFPVYISGSNREQIVDIGIDQHSNIYLTGDFDRFASFYSVNDNGPYDIRETSDVGSMFFLVKYSSEGKLIWEGRGETMRLGDFDADVYDMTTDELGNCYLSGSNQVFNQFQKMGFNNTDGTTTEKSIGQYFVLKVNPEGICEWINGASYSFYGIGHKVSTFGDKVSVVGSVAQNDRSLLTDVSFSSTDGNEYDAQLYVNDLFFAVYDTTGKVDRIFSNGVNQQRPLGQQFVTGFIQQDEYHFLLAQNIEFFSAPTRRYDFFGTTISPFTGLDGLISKFRGGCGTYIYPNFSSTESVSESESNILIHPNPTMDVVTLKNYIPEKGDEVLLFDMKGKRISYKTQSDKLEISNLMSGEYFIKILREGEVYFGGKILKVEK